VVGLLLTRDAVTTTGNLWPFFGAAVAIYLAVGVTAVLVLRSMRRRWAKGDDAHDVPYGPEPSLPNQPATRS
jgi:cytochrome d ubiquinol oxidase subunit I